MYILNVFHSLALSRLRAEAVDVMAALLAHSCRKHRETDSSKGTEISLDLQRSRWTLRKKKNLHCR